MQQFKSIYFSDHPAEQSSEKNITLAFGKGDEWLYEKIQPLSSHEIRKILGYQQLAKLNESAEKQGVSINSFCLRILRQKLKKVESKELRSQMSLPGFTTSNEFDVDPLQTTFRGGESEPLHLWYPYLEGYSPQFVKEIIKHFAPEASRVLDPFSGTGTTAITAAGMGLTPFYCEVNPLLQYLTKVKLHAYNMPSAQREVLRDKLVELAANWPTLLMSSPVNHNLDSVFPTVFGKSKFFDPSTYEMVLRARTLLDKLAATESSIIDLVTVAVLASLLSSSKLIRSGDVRYRTESEQESRTAFIEEVARRLTLMAEDLTRLSSTPNHSPTLLCEDARNLGRLPKLDLDLVVTSPPYLNGTNYFRNTKIELWFLRSLRSKQDLANFRLQAVTAGINDVTVDKVRDRVPEPVADVLGRLEETAYDVRIPRMVLSYFQDMELIFGNLRKHLRKDARVAIDLGDSVYGGVHVATDQILVEIMREQGYELDELVTLRRRRARDGTELHQVLLILSHQQSKDIPVMELTSSSSLVWRDKWNKFKSNMPHQQRPYSKRNWGSGLHSLCSYQGKMKPALAYHLVKTFVPEGGRMLDPFAGVGTIPFEAALNGAEAFGFDISPTALAISTAKLGDFDKTKCNAAIAELEGYLAEHEPTDEDYEAANEVAFNGHIPEYFHSDTLREILLARRFYQTHPPVDGSENLVFSSLLHILHGNRPYALSRRSHPITPYKPSGPTEYRPLIPRLRDKVERSLRVERPETFIPGKMYQQDATEWWPHEVADLDAIVTSPPFFDSTRFHIGNWMRLWFCGWEREDFDVKPLSFVDERQKESFEIYVPILRQARERLKPGGVMVMHLGLSHKSDMASELASIAQKWFAVEDIFVEDVEHLESHGIRDKGTVTGHQYLVLS